MFNGVISKYFQRLHLRTKTTISLFVAFLRFRHSRPRPAIRSPGCCVLTILLLSPLVPSIMASNFSWHPWIPIRYYVSSTIGYRSRRGVFETDQIWSDQFHERSKTAISGHSMVFVFSSVLANFTVSLIRLFVEITVWSWWFNMTSYKLDRLIIKTIHTTKMDEKHYI